jgi:predicted transcriptional regulator of viral defense system
MPATAATSHRDRILEVLGRKGMARLSEFLEAGATATAVSRLERDGTILRLGRGLYQLPDAALDEHHALAEAAKLVPKGVVCLVSALAFHELTDQMPRRVWMAIGSKDWRPRIGQPAIRFVRFAPESLSRHVESHSIEGVAVRITSPARTVVDLFRYRRTVGQNLAIEGLKEVLRTRKATPADIHAIASEMGQWRLIRPYLETVAHNG